MERAGAGGSTFRPGQGTDAAGSLELSPLRMRPPAILIAAALALGLTACQGGKAQRPACPSGQVCLEYGNESEPLTLDPQTANLVTEGQLKKAVEIQKETKESLGMILIKQGATSQKRASKMRSSCSTACATSICVKSRSHPKCSRWCPKT